MGGFCQDGLEGLPEVQRGLDLVGVPEGDSCLHRIDSIKGIWQHDPNRAGGSDFVGALDKLEAVLGDRIGLTGYGKIPLLKPTYDAQGKASVQVLPEDVGEAHTGWLDLLSQDQCGNFRHDKLVPQAQSGCPDNMFLLGFVKTLRTIGETEYTQYALKELSKLVLPTSQLTTVTNAEMSNDGMRVAMWKKSGDCHELVAGPQAGCAYLTEMPEDTEFGYITVCHAGVEKKLAGIKGKTLVGTEGGGWKLSGSIGEGFMKMIGDTSMFTSTDDSNDTGSFDLTSLASYKPTYTSVQVRVKARLSAFNGDALLNVQVEGQTIASARVRGTSEALITDDDTCINSEWVAIPTDKTLSFAHNFSYLGGGTSMELVESQVWITAWA